MSNFPQEITAPEVLLLKFNVEDDDGEVVAYIEQWEVE